VKPLENVWGAGYPLNWWHSTATCSAGPEWPPYPPSPSTLPLTPSVLPLTSATVYPSSVEARSGLKRRVIEIYSMNQMEPIIHSWRLPLSLPLERVSSVGLSLFTLMTSFVTPSPFSHCVGLTVRCQYLLSSISKSSLWTPLDWPSRQKMGSPFYFTGKNKQKTKKKRFFGTLFPCSREQRALQGERRRLPSHPCIPLALLVSCIPGISAYRGNNLLISPYKAL